MMPGVLIVDDDLVTQNMLTLMVSKLGFACDTATDGAEAVYKISRNRYEIVLLDLVMPVVEGNDVLRILEQLFSRGILQTPPHVIVVTGVTDPHVLSSLTKNRCVAAVIDKQVGLRQLKNIMHMFITEDRKAREGSHYE